MDPAQQFHLMTNPHYQERETMKEAAYDRLVGAINSRIEANKAKLDRYYAAEPEALSAEDAVTLRGEQAALRAVLAEAEIPSAPVPSDTVLGMAQQPNIELAK